MYNECAKGMGQRSRYATWLLSSPCCTAVIAAAAVASINMLDTVFLIIGRGEKLYISDTNTTATEDGKPEGRAGTVDYPELYPPGGYKF
jgi:hypothetical protein